MSRVRIGVSGWRYKPWRGVFYPEGLLQRRELEFASRQFDSIEINGTFYSLQRPKLFEAWYRDTPRGFRFALKGSRFITHMKKLVDIDAALANFYAQGLLLLNEKLGPFLWQFPPFLSFDESRFASFFAKLPRNTEAAAQLARGHDARLEGRAHVEIDRGRPLRHAVEVRHPSFDTPRFYALLREHNIASVIADTAGLFPYLDELTADFVYVRLHGSEQLYASGYRPEEIAMWADRIATWSKGQDAYVYFDNTDVKLRAPFDALALKEALRARA
jgi:uncharacterized protein YecE (DUF72 family)